MTIRRKSHSALTWAKDRMPTAANLKINRRPYSARKTGAKGAKPGTKAGIKAATKSRAPAKVRERNCSVARTVAILSDAWTFLVIREAFFGARRFESFRSALGLPRATLTERLKRLTRQGIFRQVRYSQTSS